jgi:hypothetical protein
MLRVSRLAPALLVVFLFACSGDACGSGCASQGFEQRPFPDEHAEKTMPQAGQVRVTDTGLTFLESEISNIINQVLPGGLNFCVPETSASGADICVASTCNSGQSGCQFDFTLENTSITPEPTETLNISVTIGDVDEDISFDALGGECVAHLHEPGADSDVATSIDAEVPISFTEQTSSPTNDVQIQLGTVQADISESAVAIDIDPRTSDFGDELVCGGADIGFIKGLIRGELESRFKDRINSAVQQAVDQQLCKQCGDMQTSCPSGSSCEPLNPDADQPTQACLWDDKDGCVGRALGLEGKLSLGKLIGGPHEPESSTIEAMLTAADHAEVAQGGLDIGMRVGAVPTPTRRCVPDTKSTRPSFDAVDLSDAILSNTKPNASESFMVSLGLHERGLEYALWSVWASGGLCVRIGSDFNRLLNTNSLGLLLSAIKDLPRQTAPLFLRLSPQTPPDVELGDNNVTSMNDMRSIEDPLLTLNWDDLDLHFYTYAQNRYVRMFTIRTDFSLPVGLATDGPSTVVPVVGSIDSAANNIRVRNADLLDTSDESIRSLLPTLLSAAGSQLTSSLVQPFELPSFFGYRIALEQDDITSVDNNTMVALYADFMRASTLRAMPRPRAPLVQIDEMTVDRTEPVPRPTVSLEVVSPRRLSAPGQTTYMWRLNDGPWHEFAPASDDSTLTIDSPILALQGEHTLELKARRRGSSDSSWSPATTKTLPIDLGPPTIDVTTHRPDQPDEVVRLGANIEDAVADREQIDVRYRWRAPDDDTRTGRWSSWRPADTIPDEGISLPSLPDWSTANVAGSRISIELQAKDPEGYKRTRSTTLKLTESTANTAERDDTAGPTTGCASAPADRPGGPWGTFGLLAIGLLGLLVHRTRRPAAASCANFGAAIVLVAGAALLSGCPGSSSQGPCNGSCGAWESCEGGVCTPTPCSSAEDCPETARCRQGQCWPCANECGSSEYCCHETASCKSMPDPCSDTSCDPGFEATVSDSPQVDASTCSASGGACECTEKPPLDLQWYGRHASADTNAGVRAVAAYNREFGDLQVGLIDDSLEATWYVPDGVPADGTTVAAPSGPRGGIQENGEDVGTHTSVAIDEAGRLHLFYRHEETGALTYARAQTTNDGLSSQVLDDIDAAGSGNGRFTATAIRDGVVHALYSVAAVENDDGQMRTHIRTVSFPVDASLDQLDPAPTVVFDSQPHNPCGNECSGDAVCLTESDSCATPDTNCGNSSCSDGFACRAGECASIYQPPEHPDYPLMTGLHTEVSVTPNNTLLAVFFDNVRERVGWISRPTDGEWSQPTFLQMPSGPYADATVGEDGKLHIAYMDLETRALRYRRTSGIDSRRPEIDERIRSSIRTGDERLTARIGHNVRIWLKDGTPHALFHDPTQHDLATASRDPDGTWSATPVATPNTGGSYSGARGFYSTMVPSSADGAVSGFAVEQVINQQSSPPGAHLQFHALP